MKRLGSHPGHSPVQLAVVAARSVRHLPTSGLRAERLDHVDGAAYVVELELERIDQLMELGVLRVADGIGRYANDGQRYEFIL